MSGSIPSTTSSGSLAPQPDARLSSTGKSMRSSPLRPNRRSCAPKKIGHTIVNNAVDRPWSQYFCCMVAGSTDYVNKYPVATKRVLRAILKSADFCASNPTLAAQAAGRSRLSAQLRRRSGNAEGDPARQVAGLRCRGFGPLLCAAHAGDGHDQVEPARDHRQRNGFPLPQRVEARVENAKS